MRISPNDILLVFRARNEGQNIRFFLNHHENMYDCFVALVDRSNDETYDLVKNHPKCAMIIEKIHDLGYSHHKDHAMLETACSYFPHKWMWRLDVDERVGLTFPDEINDMPNGVINICMRFISCYPDLYHFISGGHKYAEMIPIVRLFRRIERNKIPVRNDAPGYISNALVYHYNMLTEFRRNARYATYLKYNPEGFKSDEIQKGYSHIVDVENARFLPHGKNHNMTDLSRYLMSLTPKNATEKRDILKLVKIMSGNRWMKC